MKDCLLLNNSSSDTAEKENIYIWGQFGGLVCTSYTEFAGLNTNGEIQAGSNRYNHSGNIYTAQKIDVTNYSKLVICGRWYANGATYGSCVCGLTETGNTETYVRSVSFNTNTLVEKEIDLNDLEGEYYFTMSPYRGDYTPTHYLKYAYFVQK